MNEYRDLQKGLASGWNTWNARSFMSYVLLPHGFAINIGVKDYWKPEYLKEALMRFSDATCRPGLRSYDGRYTDLRLLWHDMDLRIQSATAGADIVILVTPQHDTSHRAVLVAESGILWNRPGHIVRDEQGVITADLPGARIPMYSTNPLYEEIYIQAQTPYYAVDLNGPAGFSTGVRRPLAEIRAIVDAAAARTAAGLDRFGAQRDVAAAIQTCIGWNTFYEPSKNRVVTPVSRDFSTHGFGGYVLFGWDTFFAALLSSIGSRELAYANAVEMTREITDAGFIPNWSGGTGAKMNDRSMPQVGGLVVREIYRRFGEAWFLEEVFDGLLSSNRWYAANRTIDGYICLGSNAFTPVIRTWEETNGQGKLLGAKFEFGLDNSPMYDAAPFDERRGLMLQADVGQMSLHIEDCEALAEIAGILHRTAEAAELTERAAYYRKNLAGLWDGSAGIFKNRVLTDGTLSPRISPTSFYPLLCGGATPAQTQRLVREHLLNETEFWGEWVLPTIARNDPAYPEQNYWRGKIWAPVNFLVYCGLRRSGEFEAAHLLAEKSAKLFLHEWREKGHVHENYSADTGLGCDRADSDLFYQWGGLLGLIALMDSGSVAGPEGALR